MNKIMGIVGLGMLGFAFIGYVIMLVVESADEGGWALLVIAVLGGCFLLFSQVLKDRLQNEEDNYYAKTVDQ